MSSPRADTPVQFVKGVGPARAPLFERAGIRTVADLLAYFPFRHEYDAGHVDIADLQPGVRATICGEVVRARAREPSFRCDVHDGTETCTLRWFQRPYSARMLQPGATVVASGIPELARDSIEFVQPQVNVFPPGAPLETQRGGRLVGVYRGVGALKSRLIRRAVEGVLLHAELPIEPVAPAALAAKRRILSRAQAIRQMHMPASPARLEAARRSLAYEELLLLELAMSLRRRKSAEQREAARLVVTPEMDARIRARFPFRLTPSQETVTREIARDLGSGRPMTRLLQGDVGSGKTVVALHACLAAIAHRRQAAIMAPTEILAQQHFRNIEKYLAGSRVRSVLLRGRIPPARRSEILRRIEAGEVDLVVGTQALIQRDVAFSSLALVVVDEQHKFGVLQRRDFRTKGPLPHYLVMTATPIPRTLAMTVFGDLDVSTIRRPPPGRGRILTRVVPVAKRETVLTYVRARLEAGEQAYVVCPQIGDQAPPPDDAPPSTDARRASKTARPDAQGESKTAIDVHRELAAGPWAGLKVGLLHGGLSSAEKERVIGDFASGGLRALVSTTVVEVGVDVPSATIMIVEGAERFGLAQLHQLRGRVGRGSRESLCVLMVHEWSAKAAERLGVLARSNDGFRIAEEDLRLRGPGEMLGTRQHGLPELQAADLSQDFAIVEAARDDAAEIVARDPHLREPDHARLIPALRKMFGDKLALIDAA